MTPRRRQRAADPRVATGDQVAPRLPARLAPHLEAVLPPAHEHAIEVPGTGRMMVDLARRAVVGLLATVAAFGFFVLAVALDWPGGAIFWIFALFWIVALTAGRRPLRAVRAWRYVRRTPWRYYEAKASAGSRGERIELAEPGRSEIIYLRVTPDRRTDELLKRTATYQRVWFVGSITGRGLVVPAGGGLPVPTRRVVPLATGQAAGSLQRFVPYGRSASRMERERRAVEREAARARKWSQKAQARRAERLRKHPPKPVRVAKKPARAAPVRTPEPPRQGWGRRRRNLSQFLPTDHPRHR